MLVSKVHIYFICTKNVCHKLSEIKLTLLLGIHSLLFVC